MAVVVKTSSFSPSSEQPSVCTGWKSVSAKT